MTKEDAGSDDGSDKVGYVYVKQGSYSMLSQFQYVNATSRIVEPLTFIIKIDFNFSVQNSIKFTALKRKFTFFKPDQLTSRKLFYTNSIDNYV